MNQKKISAFIVLAIILALVWQFNSFSIKAFFVPPSVEVAAEQAYGLAKEGSDDDLGVFRIERSNPDYTAAVWMRSYAMSDFDEQANIGHIGRELLSYNRLSTMFKAKDANLYRMIYCYNSYGNDGFNKVLMIDVSRDDFLKLSKESYNSDEFYKYFKLVDASKRDFPSLQQFIK